MTPTAEGDIDRELEQAHALLLLDLNRAGSPQVAYILTPPPADDPE